MEEAGTCRLGGYVIHTSVRVHGQYTWVACRSITRGFDFRPTVPTTFSDVFKQSRYGVRVVDCKNCIRRFG